MVINPSGWTSKTGFPCGFPGLFSGEISQGWSTLTGWSFCGEQQFKHWDTWAIFRMVLKKAHMNNVGWSFLALFFWGFLEQNRWTVSAEVADCDPGGPDCSSDGDVGPEPYGLGGWKKSLQLMGLEVETKWGNQRSYGKSPFLMGKLTINGNFQ